IGREFCQSIGFIVRPAVFDRYILTLNVAGLFQALAECGQMLRIRTGEGYVQKANHRQRRLLCARRERPRHRTAEQRDELAALHHSITWSVRASNVVGTSRPSALAVIRLMTRSNLVGCSTGRSAGFAPRKILST